MAVKSLIMCLTDCLVGQAFAPVTLDQPWKEKKMITLRNEFHNTETRVRAQIGDTLSANQADRAARNLCGLYGCVCGGEAGQRGPQHTDDGRRFVLSDHLTLKYYDDHGYPEGENLTGLTAALASDYQYP